MRTTKNRGITLLETLVVVSIIGVLVALVIPAVAGAREASRRVQCVNQLKQIGISLHNFEATNRVFPSPMPYRFGKAGIDTMSGYFELLPFLDLMSMYNSINLSDNDDRFVHRSPDEPENTSAFHTKVALFICPSDVVDPALKTSPCSFRFNLGSSFPAIVTPIYKRGAFDIILPIRAAEITDGLSNTAGFGERLIGSQNHTRFDSRRDFWGANVFALGVINNDDDVLNVCRSLTLTPSRFDSTLGKTWMKSGPYFVGYNHVAPPNERSTDCSTADLNTNYAQWCDSCSIGLRSFHPSGVNCLMMDGSIRFPKRSINLAIWRSLGSRAGRESISDDW